MKHFFVVFQLILSLGLLFWILLTPFTSETFFYKILLNKTHFLLEHRENLKDEEVSFVEGVRADTEKLLSLSAYDKAMKGFDLLFFKTPFYFRMYLFLSLFLCALFIKDTTFSPQYFMILLPLLFLHLETQKNEPKKQSFLVDDVTFERVYLAGEKNPSLEEYKRAFSRYIEDRFSEGGNRRADLGFELAYLQGYKDHNISSYSPDPLFTLFLFSFSLIFSMNLFLASCYKALLSKRLALACKISSDH